LNAPRHDAIFARCVRAAYNGCVLVKIQLTGHREDVQLQHSLTAEYWTDSFKVTRADLEFLLSLFSESELPITRRDLAVRLVERRLQQEGDRLRKQLERGAIFQPKQAYAVGAEVLFPALDYAAGTVVAARPGLNPDAGEFTVIEVEFENRKRREFASMLSTHKLNIDEQSGQRGPSIPLPNVDDIMAAHGESIIDEIEARLVDEEDAISFADLWYMQTLMPDVSVGHLHLAEAVLDINEGGPLTSTAIINDIDLAQEAPLAAREFALNVALNNDDRFDDVGASGQVLWFLRRLEPEEVLNTPVRLLYAPLDYDPAVLTDELRQLEREIDDELSPLEPPSVPPSEATLTLNYAHRRAGTLPLTSKVRGMFPTALESPRIRMSFVDSSDGQTFAGWVVHEDRYVYGLWEFYSKHKMPIGGYLTLKKTDDPSKVQLSFGGYRPRSEYIRLAQPQNGRLTFANFKRSIGAPYDELLIVGAEDIKGVDAVWKLFSERRRGLTEIMKDLVPELSKLSPQNAVHAKTLYAAVNIVRRCPPGPIFATLVTRDDFTHVGGPYWRLKSG
jgi:hypothetical protein